ncbi:MAG: hypothetical protein GXP56_06440 [Deltaproteobacteria bacterium]|nr:hypothetical protein [Deltaproteobacteria bacterium]
MNAGNISNLAFLARNDPAIFKDILLSCNYAPFKETSPQDFKNKYQKIISIKDMPDGMKELFNLYLLTKFFLMKRRKRPLWVESFLADNIDVKKYFGFCLSDAKKGSWCTVPVIFTGNASAYIRLFVIGLISTPACDMVPKWAGKVLDDTLKQAMKSAKQVATHYANIHGEKAFLCFPLTIPGKTIQLKDASLGLSLAIGFTKLLTRTVITGRLVATGDIAPDGTITRVGHIKEKISRVKSQFDGLIYPLANNVVSRGEKPVLIPISTFKQAWMFFSLYSQKNKDQLLLLSNIIKDPKLFADNVGNLPSEWITWIQKEHTIDKTLNEVTKQPSIFFIFTSRFEKIVESYQLEKGKAIRKLIKKDKLDCLSGTSPVAALKWCSKNLSLANHLGRIKTASKWEKYGQTLTGRVLQADIGTVVTFYNHAMILNHNRFCFHENFSNELKRLIEFLESQYRQKCNFGCPTDLLMGRLYGTMMQNFAFCGPGYIKKSEEFSQKARKALGEGTSDEFKEDWKRHLSYITFARLDAGAFIKAEESLKAYLEMNSLEDIMAQPVKPDTWGYALLARFFGQVKNHPLKIKFYQWIKPGLDNIIMDTHPWQLFSYNAGRIAGSLDDIDEAVKLLNKSIDICFSNHSGPSIRVMSLLPISIMACYKKEIKNAWERDIRASAGKLDADHFNFLKNPNFKAVLEKVRKYPEAIFPFTYR